MLNSENLNNLSNKIRRLLENSPAEDLDKNIHALIQGAFTKMGLVSREEFDVQAKVLRNAQEQLKALENKLSTLEAQSK